MNKILMINCSGEWGGGEILTLNLIKGLLKEKVDVTLLCNPNTPIEKMAKKETIPKISISMRKPYDPIAIINLQKIIKNHKIDIVHSHTMRGHILSSLATIFSNTKIIRSQHIHFPKTFKNFLRSIYNDLTNMTLCVSNFIKTDLECNGISPDKLKVIYNGLDEEKFIKNNTPPSIIKDLKKTDSFIISCIGRLIKDKGQQDLIKAAPPIISKFPKVKILIVGDGENKEYLKRLSKELKLEKNIIFTGVRHDIPNILTNSNMAVIPSIWQDPCPLSVMEPMLAGIPVIASNVGGIPEMINNGIDGLLIPPQNPDTIEKIITEILSNEFLLKALAANAHKKAKENFTLKRMVKDICNVYSSLSFAKT